ncbi:MAG TPA: SPOR domain-containing protein [Gemmatimonadaceae bacterium]|nr:SPOR domain-containing protein [Gemmatimonadaceae bacterium]
MRTTLFLASAIVLVACGHSDRRPGAPAVTDASPASTTRGIDELALRFPLHGGKVRVFAYPALDSLVWTSDEKAPPIARVLSFSDGAGSVAAVDTKGVPVRVSLRLGSVATDGKARLTHVTSDDGWSIYGATSHGHVVRMTPNGSWVFTPPAPVHDLFPLPDGALIVVGARGDSTALWRLHPPDSSVTDSVILPLTADAQRTAVGDRLYLVADSALIGVDTRTLSLLPAITLPSNVRALAITPSGDRFYALVNPGTRLLIIDRYTSQVVTTITLPGQASALRMDPMGRAVLARAEHGDSAWVVAIGTDRLIGTVRTAWRSDLPAVLPDGALALLHDTSVVVVDGSTLSPRRTVSGGDADAWLFIAWNGFRPRTAELDEPLAYASSDSASMDTVAADTMAAVSARSDTAPPSDTQALAPEYRTPAEPSTAPPRPPGFTVQFAAVRSGQSARQTARDIAVGGSAPRIDSNTVAGVTIYRVVIGPYPTRAAADSAGRASGRPYWIYGERP